MDETYEGDDYIDAEDIDNMTDEELAAYEAYENREYDPSEMDQEEFESSWSKLDEDQAISHHNLIERVEGKGTAIDPVEQQYEIPTRQSHNPTVEYKEDTVDIDGIQVTGSFPEFESAKDVSLPGDLRFESVSKQESFCNSELQRDVQENPDQYKDVFTPEQLAQIEKGEKPAGFTWHHNQEVGKMQLVDAQTHDENRHLGGFALWGGEKR